MTGKPTPVKRYHDYLLQTVTDLNAATKWFVSPLNLGGVPGEEGGSGVPLAGVVGQLIQSKVAYDTTEASTLYTPVSGASLVDNLNHIRYWIDTISGGGAITFLDLTDAPDDYSGYAGYSAVVNTGEDGLEFVNVSGGAGSDSLMVKVSSNDTTEGYLEDKVVASGYITVTTLNEAANEEVQISVAMDLNELDDVTITSPAQGESLTYDSGTWINTLVSGGASLEVQENDIQKVTDVTVLNFEGGAEVTDEGGGKATITISGGAGGAADCSVWMPDAPPATPYSSGGIDDDEFDDASFDTGIWTEFDYGATQTVTENEWGLSLITSTTDKFQGVIQPVPSGNDWSFTTYIAQVHDQVNDECAGILLIDDITNLDTANVFIWGTFRGGAGYGWRWAKATDYTGTGYSDGSWINDSKDFTYYIRFRTNGTTWSFDMSTDGYNWVHNAYTQTAEFTPSGIGLGHRINDTAWRADYKFARFKDDSTYNQMLYGDRVNLWRAS